MCEPRLLLLVHKKHIEEVFSSIVTEESVIEHEFMPEIKLNYCDNTMIIYEDKDEPSFCNETPLNYKTEESEPNETVRTRLDTENFSIQEKNDKILEISIQYQENLKNQKELINKMIEENKQKSLELSAAYDQIFQLKNALQQYENENFYLKNSQILEFSIKDLVSENSQYKKIIENFESSAKENCLTSTANSERIYEPLGKLIRNYCETMNIKPLVKDLEEVYVFGNKKLNISLKNGKLVCRIGNSYKDFKQYIDEINNEGRNNVYSFSARSPFRKNLGEFNSNIETPKNSLKLSDTVGSAKSNSVRKISRTQKAKVVKRNF